MSLFIGAGIETRLERRNKMKFEDYMDKLLKFNSYVAFGSVGLEDDSNTLVYRMSYSAKPSEGELLFSKTQFKQYLTHTLWICTRLEDLLIEGSI
jgi:hypothetical protein